MNKVNNRLLLRAIGGGCGEFNVNKEKLAKVIGCSRGTLHRKLNNNSEFTLFEFISMAKYLHFTDDEILKIVKS